MKQKRRLVQIPPHPTSPTAGCGKARYSEEMARDVVRRARDRRRLEVYYCAACSAWHVASARKP